MYTVKPMTMENAAAISLWTYPREYSIYSFSNDKSAITELMNGEYHSCTDGRGELVGYFCFGRSAVIPAEEDYTSDSDKIDIGLGLAPELCGRGYGKGFMTSGIEYAKRDMNAVGLRLVVAKFNKRAIALYRNCGFVEIGEVTHMNSKAGFIVMRRAL